MIFQSMGSLEIWADIFGAILVFFKPIVKPIGQFMVNWISATFEFFKENLGNNLTFFIFITVIIVVSGVIINIIWPGDRPGSIFSKEVEKTEEKIDISEDKIEETIKRCRDCGNPIGDSKVCPLCGAEND
jgi:hypothetical protein